MGTHAESRIMSIMCTFRRRSDRAGGGQKEDNNIPHTHKYIIYTERLSNYFSFNVKLWNLLAALAHICNKTVVMMSPSGGYFPKVMFVLVSGLHCLVHIHFWMINFSPACQCFDPK